MTTTATYIVLFLLIIVISIEGAKKGVNTPRGKKKIDLYDLCKPEKKNLLIGSRKKLLEQCLKVSTLPYYQSFVFLMKFSHISKKNALKKEIKKKIDQCTKLKLVGPLGKETDKRYCKKNSGVYRKWTDCINKLKLKDSKFKHSKAYKECFGSNKIKPKSTGLK
ncbi:uncharacterized protein LOC141858782 isoform X1 [Brevipalpus obovatus]|uniref:uncharacterized protein LOC141858782 isoform X1 n=1 Tax=Brevipalpus obovatus TaxID=246614 RepID=UPI003D9F24C3